MTRLYQKLIRALKALKEVEEREWYAILLAASNPIDEGGEAVKLIKVAMAYERFLGEYPDAKFEVRREAYSILRKAFDGGRFPPRKYLNGVQFGELLDLHLLMM